MERALWSVAAFLRPIPLLQRVNKVSHPRCASRSFFGQSCCTTSGPNAEKAVALLLNAGTSYKVISRIPGPVARRRAGLDSDRSTMSNSGLVERGSLQKFPFPLGIRVRLNRGFRSWLDGG